MFLKYYLQMVDSKTEEEIEKYAIQFTKKMNEFED